MIAILLHCLLRLVMTIADLGHCVHIYAGPHGPRCPVVRLAPKSCHVVGWHVVLGTPVCTSNCGADGAPTS